jgi:hypothetical protein
MTFWYYFFAKRKLPEVAARKLGQAASFEQKQLGPND